MYDGGYFVSYVAIMTHFITMGGFDLYHARLAATPWMHSSAAYKYLTPMVRLAKMGQQGDLDALTGDRGVLNLTLRTYWFTKLCEVSARAR